MCSKPFLIFCSTLDIFLFWHFQLCKLLFNVNCKTYTLARCVIKSINGVGKCLTGKRIPSHDISISAIFQCECPADDAEKNQTPTQPILRQLIGIKLHARSLACSRDKTFGFEKMAQRIYVDCPSVAVDLNICVCVLLRFRVIFNVERND